MRGEADGADRRLLPELNLVPDGRDPFGLLLLLSPLVVLLLHSRCTAGTDRETSDLDKLQAVRMPVAAADRAEEWIIRDEGMDPS